jgi:homogentisate 1,2-dioxygenase
MAYYQRVGNVPAKRHVQHREDGAGSRLFYEELMGEEGFSSDSSLLYHRHIPASIVDSQVWELNDHTLTPNHPLKPRHLRLHDLFPEQVWVETDLVTGRRLILGNSDVRLQYVVGRRPSPLYRSAIGDEMLYIESGDVRVETVFGVLEATKGDYVNIPRACTHRFVPQGEEPVRAYIIEASSHIGPPSRFLSKQGQLLEHAPYCERDIHGPTQVLLAEGQDVEVYVKQMTSRGIVGTKFTVPQHPFDVVGWDGCLYPWKMSIHDYEPLTGRVHQPPPAHQVWEGHNFVVCNFVPRLVDYHPLAIPVPYYHANVDSDEIMFYVDGDYEARKGSGINVGSISVHPGGHTHGPQPGAVENSLGVQYFDELAVMVDTFKPLDLGEGALACEDPEYAWSWARNDGGNAPEPVQAGAGERSDA